MVSVLPCETTETYATRSVVPSRRSPTSCLFSNSTNGLRPKFDLDLVSLCSEFLNRSCCSEVFYGRSCARSNSCGGLFYGHSAAIDSNLVTSSSASFFEVLSNNEKFYSVVSVGSSNKNLRFSSLSVSAFSRPKCYYSVNEFSDSVNLVTFRSFLSVSEVDLTE